MTETHLDKLRKLTEPASDEPGDGEGAYAAFSFGRVSSKPQLTLRVRRVTGTCDGFAYAHLYTLDFDPSVGIVLRFSQHRVVIRGRNLDELYRYLTLHRVDVIQVIDPLLAETLAPDQVVTGVESVAIRDLVGLE